MVALAGLAVSMGGLLYYLHPCALYAMSGSSVFFPALFGWGRAKST